MPTTPLDLCHTAALQRGFEFAFIFCWQVFACDACRTVHCRLQVGEAGPNPNGPREWSFAEHWAEGDA